MRFELIVEGMVAVHAKHALFSALAGVEGLIGAEVELGRATVEFASPAGDARGREAALRAAVESAGFRLESVRALPRTLPTL
jgi:hypothetical protein